MTTKIEWCDHTINPVVGCRKISEGCENCYAERMAKRLKGMGLPQYQDVVDKNGWTGKQVFVPKQIDKIKITKKPSRIFIGSMCDLFQGMIDDYVYTRTEENIIDILDCLENIKKHKFLFLTKRPKKMKIVTENYHPDNFWLGVTCENQETAEKRIPILLDIPAKVRWVSCEPLLSEINLKPYLKTGKLHWVVIGGETGHGARPMHPFWVKSIIRQCEQYNVPVFFKSWGDWWFYREFDSYLRWVQKARTWMNKSDLCMNVYGDVCTIGKDFMFARDNNRFPIGIFQKVGKKHTGYLVDGKEYRQFPG